MEKAKAVEENLRGMKLLKAADKEGAVNMWYRKSNKFLKKRLTYDKH